MNFGERYGLADRIFHRIAFRAGVAQHALADVEDLLFSEELSEASAGDPVLITALPRSGTTILLKVLVETGEFASHTYRDMPFVLCPLLWNRFSRRFAAEDTARERAHGDGLEVSADSPEAFEEMIWKHFWLEHYEADRIVPWTDPEPDSEFEKFFRTHMRKVVRLRRDGPGDCRRYLSKNNLNIARLAARPGPVADAVVVIPFREPVQQAASMLAQHRRFLRIHDEDDFVREYMESIGHHEFGRGLKPVDFGEWLEDAPSPRRLEFWLRYWIAAYRHVYEHADGSDVFVSYARLTETSQESLARLAGCIDVPESDLVALAERLRPPRTHDVDRAALSDETLRCASSLYERLRDRAEV